VGFGRAPGFRIVSTQMSDAADLLRRYAEHGADDAFTDFTRQYFDLVYSAALRQVGGDTHAARDVAQNVFTDAARRASLLARHPAIVGWLYTSTHFWAAKFRRTEERRRRREQIAYVMNEGEGQPTDWSAIRPHLDEAMQALPARDREAVLMRFFEQMSFAAIGQKLGVQENTASMRVSRALQKLRLVLARRGVTSTGAALGTVLAQQAVGAAPSGACAAIASTALASTGGTSLGTAALAWHFMITSKATMGTVGILTAIALGCGWHASVQARHSEEAAHRAYREREIITATVGEGKSGGAAIPPQSRPAAAAPLAASSAASRRAAELARAIGREMTENPDLRRSLGAHETAKFHLEHLELYRRLGLTAAQIDAVEKARLKSRSDELDLMEAAAEVGNTSLSSINKQLATLPSLKNARQQVLAREREALRPVLSDAALAEFADYERTLPARSAVNQAMSALVFSDTPLTSAQCTDLVRAIATHSPEYRVGESIDLATVDWKGVLGDASKLLAPAQIARLRALSDRSRSNSELDTRI
jgi:RNA polymerase sigma factor (sigma-70 family)